MKIPSIITWILSAIGLFGILYIFQVDLSATKAERIDITLSIIATFGAMISATYVIYSYIQTNRAFVESQRPQLLIQVSGYFADKKQDDKVERVHMTRVDYKNITANQFSDLTISIVIKTANNSTDLSDLFSSNMIMIGHDLRARKFETQAELLKRCFDFNTAIANSGELKLVLSYSYSYLGLRQTVKCQDYKWDVIASGWGIV